ncbi:MAG: hypothetical protein J0I20_26645 [Chloroflexi bacterium]|nr:hypothetical protein [Chloroflexota bacterium]OJV91933.1 MAG: hypothetical protein BGO39_14540 [Chloroflexi bacterium 54-19]
MTQAYNRTGHTVVGVFEDPADAEQAINDLKVAGFTPDSLSVVAKDRNVQRDLTEASGNEAGQGALVGSLGGGTLGAVLGWLLAGGTALIPGVGPIVAAGVFGATVGGALIGGTLGGITGALAGAGVPEDEAAEYGEHVKSGNSLVTAYAANGQLMEAALDVFSRNKAVSTRYYDLTRPGPGQVYSRSDTTGEYPGEVNKYPYDTDSAGTTGDYEAVSPTNPPMTSDLGNDHPRYGTVATDDGESVGTVANPPGQNQPYRETPYTERGQTLGDDTYPTERVDKDGFPPRAM